MAESASDLLTFITTESRSSAAQEAIRVHVLRNRHRQRRETHRVRGKDKDWGKNKDLSPASGFAQYGGQFQIWQSESVSHRRQQTSPDAGSIVQESESHDSGFNADPAFAVGQSPDEGIECISPSSISPCENSSTASEKESPSSDRQAIEEMLIQHYILSGGSPLAYEFLRAFRQSRATFSAFLAMVATRLSDEQGDEPVLDPAELENQALQGVAREIAASPTVPAWSTIRTVVLLAYLRDGRDAACHWSGLLEMVRLHGGLEGLRAHGGLYAFLLWAEGVAVDGFPMSIGQLDPSHVELQGSGPGGASMQDLRGFLGKINAQLAEHTDPSTIPTCKLTSPVLVSLQRPPVKRARYVCDKWRRARLACLVCFASLSVGQPCRLQDNPQYRVMEAEVLSRERRYTVYAEELYYITVLVSNTDHHCELTWLVARRVNALKELNKRDQNTCYRLLAMYLGFQDPHAADMVCSEWKDLSERLVAVGETRRVQEMEPPDRKGSPKEYG